MNIDTFITTAQTRLKVAEKNGNYTEKAFSMKACEIAEELKERRAKDENRGTEAGTQ